MKVNYTDEYIDCIECDGKGSQEMIDCTIGSSSMCCGGCYKYVPCEECNGTGEIENENYDGAEN